ncbi:hypothetical protein PV327_002136 [Microctonus hyperodae]|uniref:Uncharacterized protein n=1 Tax=Microctonus hyperodae TaxID=165561 RepID=A0AA39FF00_MICHY|nr:hypothetical protein PV327_002136 [Microctonus hyperodae]
MSVSTTIKTFIAKIIVAIIHCYSKSINIECGAGDGQGFPALLSRAFWNFEHVPPCSVGPVVEEQLLDEQRTMTFSAACGRLELLDLPSLGKKIHRIVVEKDINALNLTC